MHCVILIGIRIKLLKSRNRDRALRWTNSSWQVLEIFHNSLGLKNGNCLGELKDKQAWNQLYFKGFRIETMPERASLRCITHRFKGYG